MPEACHALGKCCRRTFPGPWKFAENFSTNEFGTADCKRGRRKGATSKNVKKCQKVFRHFSTKSFSKSFLTFFDNFRAAPFFWPLLQKIRWAGQPHKFFDVRPHSARCKTSGNRKRWRQTGLRQSTRATPIDDTDPTEIQYRPRKPHGLAKHSRILCKREADRNLSIDHTSSIRI